MKDEIRPNLELLGLLKISRVTQKELSRRTRLTEPYISGIVTGRINPGLTEKRLIAKALRVSQKKIF